MSNTFADFIADENREGVYLYEVTRKLLSTGNVDIVRFSTGEWGTQPDDTVASKLYLSRVLAPYSFSGSAGTSGEGGLTPMLGLLPALEGGSFSVGQDHGDLDYFRLYTFDKQSVTIRYGGISKHGILPYAEFREVFNGVCDGQPQIGIDQVTFKLKTRDQLLDSPMNVRRYHGGNWCYYASGGTQEVNFTHNAAYDFTSGDTPQFEFWYFPITAGVAQVIAGRGATSVAGWQIFQNVADCIGFRTNQSGATQVTTSNALTMEDWNHVVIRYDGGAVCTIEINGEPSVASAGTHIAPDTSANNFYLFHSNSGADFCDCLIKEFRISDIHRTEAETRQRMYRQLTDLEASDVHYIGYWKFDEGTGTAITDFSATGQNGTASGTGTWLPSLQGGEELQGSIVPDVFGYRRGVYPTLVHAQHAIYQLHSNLIDAVVTVREGLNEIEEGDAPSPYLYSFLAGTTDPMKYELLNTPIGSYIRFGSKPALPLSVEMRGDKSDGTYRNNPVDIVRYVVCTRGATPLTDATDIDDAAFDAVAASLVLGSAADVTAPCGHAVYDDTTVAEFCNFLLMGVGVSMWFKRNGGRLTVKRYEGAEAGTPVASFNTLNDVKNGSLNPKDAGSPIGAVSVAWGFNDVVLAPSDIAGAMLNTPEHAFAEKDWRIATQDDPDTLELHPSAGTMSVESALSYWNDAIMESLRVQQIHKDVPQAWRGMFTSTAIFDLERLDTIAVHIVDLDQYGDEQSRLGTSETTKFTVLDLEEAMDEGGLWVTFVRENNAS